MKLLATRRSFLLLGPRQTGKSTLIRSLAPELEINFADEETYVAFLRDPGLLKQRIRNAATVFIYGIQRIPSLLNTVQSLLDQELPPKFFMAGSSARKLKRGETNVMPGRIFTYGLGPLLWTEPGGRFSVRRRTADRFTKGGQSLVEGGIASGNGRGRLRLSRTCRGMPAVNGA